MTPDHWLLAGLSLVTMLYMAWSMARIVTVQREIARILREIRDR
jgi:hypothetical protein